MNQTPLQQQLFDAIKDRLPANVSMAASIADVLNISEDSVYRRIRGEKQLTLVEFETLCNKYALSADELMQHESGRYVFGGHLMDEGPMRLERWADSLINEIAVVTKGRNVEVFYLAKDIPLMQLMAFPRLAAFKHHFWNRIVLFEESFRNRKFNASSVSPEVAFMGSQLASAYAGLSSTEVWNVHCLSSLLRQIDFYRTTGLFENAEDADLLLNEIDLLLDHLQAQAEKGYKFLPGAGEQNFQAALRIFINEIQMGDDTLIVQSDENCISFLTHSFINYLHTRSRRFNSYLLQTVKKVIGRSTLISWSGERERNMFFNHLRNEVNQARINKKDVKLTL